MSNQNTGGPAFPYEYFDGQLNKQRVMAGMNLRDYFAAKAMSTLLQTINGVSGCNRYEYRIAEEAYIFADAMLKARQA